MMLNWKSVASCVLTCALVHPAYALTDEEKQVVATQWKRANEAFDMQKFDEATTALEPALKLVPGNPFMREKRGEAEMYLYRWREAEADLTVAINAYGSRREAARPLAMRAVVWRAEARPDLALQDHERAAALDPESNVAHYAVAQDLQFSDPQRALQELKRCLELAPRDVPAHSLHAKLIARSGDLAAAKKELDTLIAEADGHSPPQELAFAWSARSLIALELGDAAEARQDARQSLKLQSTSAAGLEDALASVFLRDIPAATAMLRSIASSDLPLLNQEGDGRWWSIPLASIAALHDIRGSQAQLAFGLVSAARGDSMRAREYYDSAAAGDAGLANNVQQAKQALPATGLESRAHTDPTHVFTPRLATPLKLGQRAPKILFSTSCKPKYPPEALQAKASGATRVRLVIGADGRATDAEIIGASGPTREHRLLDDTTRGALMNCNFQPAVTEDGTPIAATVDVQYNWKLD